MQTRQNPGIDANGVPSSMFEGTFGEELPSSARLREWGQLGIALLRNGRADLLELPDIDDTPIEMPPPEPDDPASDAARCAVDHEATTSETPPFDIVATVRGVQERLRWLGFHEVMATNRLDEPTRKALRLFQESLGLVQSGFPDEPTRTALADRTLW